MGVRASSQQPLVERDGIGPAVFLEPWKILLPAETLSQPAPKIEPGPARIGRGRDSVGPLQGTIVAAEQAVSFGPRGGRKHHMRLLARDVRKRPEEGYKFSIPQL